jgi:hypothetical protein
MSRRWTLIARWETFLLLVLIVTFVYGSRF